MKNTSFRKSSRIICHLIMICMIALIFSSCSKTNSFLGISEETSHTSSSSDNATPSNILTDIFSATRLNVPDDFWMIYNVTPYYDEEAETVTVFSITKEEVPIDEIFFKEKTIGWLYTFTLDGDILKTTKLDLPDDVSFVYGGAVTEEALIYVEATKKATSIYRYDRISETTTSTERGTRFFGKENFVFSFLSVDDEGKIYCTDANTVFIMNPDLSLASSFDFPTTIYSMARGSDGSVWTVFNAGMESCAAKIDAEAQKLGDYHTFDRGAESLDRIQHNLVNASTDNETYNFYYYDADAIWGVNVEEDSSLTEERQIDLHNSGITELLGRNEHSMMQAGLYAVALLTDDLLMTTQYDGWQSSIPILYQRSSDIDLSDIQTLTIAHAYSLEPSVIDKISEFKQNHPDIIIALEDYSNHATEENPLGGEDKLCFDLINGFIKPDIIITRAAGNTVADNMVMTQLYRNNLYVDLTPYLEKDDVVNFDTLFGCIPRLFDDGRGGMWGISTEFSYSTVIGNPALLSQYAQNGSWTLDEMLDYMEAFPSDSEKYYGYNRLWHKWLLLAQGYSYFIDNNECSFESESFIRLLNYLKSLPETYIKWQQASLYANLTSDEYKGAFTSGKIALDSFDIFYGFSSYRSFRALVSGEVFPIGYATKTDSGARVTADHAYVITTFAENPDLSFELIKSFFERTTFNIADSNNWPLFALKPHFEKAMQVYTSAWASAEILNEEELSALYHIFDHSGNPLLNQTPDAIVEIVEEEISAYLAGMGTAEDCAMKIQSRVGIWLAEHE